MSRLTSLTKNLTDLYNKDTHKVNYQYKKSLNTHKFNGISSDSSLEQNIILNNNYFQNQSATNYAQKIFNEAEINNIPYNNSNKSHNININTSAIINPFNNNDDKNHFQKFITIRDIIGEKCELNLDLLNLFFENYDESKTSKKTMGYVKSYGVNTYQGIVRNYNEDRVSIIINMNKPKNYLKKWPKISFFGIYDGHGGEGCAEYLRDNLHKLICENDLFPDNIPEAIKLGISKAEYDFLNNYALSPNKEEILDKSGSCAIIIIIVDTLIYIANVGDSRCLLSMDDGKKFVVVTKDHKPNSPNEIMRIKNNGGNIYQSQTIINNLENSFLNGKILIGPYRVIPGRLSVSRTIGDAESKIEKFGGNPHVVIPEPDVFFYDLKKDNLDFFILGCDGIYDQMSNNEILYLAWMVLKNNIEHKENGLNLFNENNDVNIKDLNNIHYKSGLIVDLILKSSLARKSFDNVTCLFISFKDFFEQEKANGIDIKKSIETNNNIININNNINGKINPAFSGITPQKIIEKEKTNGALTSNLNGKKKFDKIYTIKNKSNIAAKKMMFNVSKDENKSKTNRNENRKDLSNKINNNKVNKIFHTESKIKSMNLISYNDYDILDNKNNKEVRTDLNNGLENKNFKKILKKPHLSKENPISFTKENNKNKLINNRAQANLMTYSKKNQSFNKNKIDSNNKNNNTNYKHIRKNKIDINTYNAYTTKKLSAQNTSRMNSNNLNSDNFHIFKPITKINKLNQPFKLIETKNNYLYSSKTKSNDNKSSLIINNMNNLNLNNHKYLNRSKERNIINNNSSYLSFNNNLYNYDNSTNINSKYRYYNNHAINNSNSTIINSFLNKNNTLKKPKKYLSLNNTQNLTFDTNHAFSISNNLMINRYINNAFTTKMKRDLTSKLKQFSKNKSFQNNNNNHNNVNISTDNINMNMNNIKKPSYIYNYAEKTRKIRSYHYNYKNNLDSKSYRNFTYNANKNKKGTKYNTYLMTDLGKVKNKFIFDDSKKDIY